MSQSPEKKVMTFQEMRRKLNEPVPEPPPPIDLDGIKEQAREEGHRQALEQVQAAQEAQAEAERSAQELIRDFEELKAAWVNEIRSHLGGAMMSAIKKLIQLPEAQTAILEKSFAEAVSQLAENQPVTVYVQPSDLSFAEQLASERVHFKVKPDSSMSGGVRFSGEQGEWDAKLEIAVDSLIDSLQHWLQEDEADRL